MQAKLICKYFILSCIPQSADFQPKGQDFQNAHEISPCKEKSYKIKFFFSRLGTKLFTMFLFTDNRGVETNSFGKIS